MAKVLEWETGKPMFDISSLSGKTIQTIELVPIEKDDGSPAALFVKFTDGSRLTIPSVDFLTMQLNGDKWNRSWSSKSTRF